MSKPVVLIIATNPLHNGPRMIREIDALKNDYRVVAVGSTPPHERSIEYHNSSLIEVSFADRLVRKLYKVITGSMCPYRLRGMNRRIHQLLDKIRPQYVIVHNPVHLPYILSYKATRIKVIYNAHEYHPLEFDNEKKWMNTWGKFFYRLYQENLPKVDLLINVCQSIADKCREEFGKESLVVPNAAAYYPQMPPKVNNGPVRIIHHGIAIKERQIEIMIDGVGKLGPQYQLDLMLASVDSAYYDSLKAMAGKVGNVRLIPVVPFREIVPFIHSYDIGLFNLPPHNYNYKVALPNKLFEFIQARLAIVVSPSVEMEHIVRQHNLGVIGSDYSSRAVAEAIGGLSRADIVKYKENADKAASLLSAEHYQAKFLEAITKL